MAFFAVSYDLVKRKDYQTLWDEFKRLNAHKCLRSMYLLDANNTAEEVKDHLKTFIDNDDQLIVVEFSDKPFHHKAFTGTNNWIKARF